VLAQRAFGQPRRDGGRPDGYLEHAWHERAGRLRRLR
jgi:hypothetical protein